MSCIIETHQSRWESERFWSHVSIDKSGEYIIIQVPEFFANFRIQFPPSSWVHRDVVLVENHRLRHVFLSTPHLGKVEKFHGKSFGKSGGNHDRSILGTLIGSDRHPFWALLFDPKSEPLQNCCGYPIVSSDSADSRRSYVSWSKLHCSVSPLKCC